MTRLRDLPRLAVVAVLAWRCRANREAAADLMVQGCVELTADGIANGLMLVHEPTLERAHKRRARSKWYEAWLMRVAS